jgi:hypothetical protein
LVPDSLWLRVEPLLPCASAAAKSLSGPVAGG